MFKLYDSIAYDKKKPRHSQEVSAGTLINLIKKPSNGHKSVVSKARAIADSNKDFKANDDYKNIKTYKLPCYHANRLGDASTGFIYLDIDGFQSEKQAREHRELLISTHKDLIYACWLSLSNRGLGILVKATVCEDNFKDYWESLYTIFNIDNHKIDAKTNDFSRQNVLSYDPTIYSNDDSTIFSISGDVSEDLKKVYELEYSINSLSDTKVRIPFSPIKLREIPQDVFSSFVDVNRPVVVDEKKKVIQINTYWYRNNKIKVGKRAQTLNAITMQLLNLNCVVGQHQPHVEVRILQWLLLFNERNAEIPLGDKEVAYNFNRKCREFRDSGPFEIERYKKSRKLFFHPECGLTYPEKMRVMRKALNEAASRSFEQTDARINEAIEDLQDNCNKITQKRVSAKSELALTTIKKHWHSFKALVNQYNTSLKPTKIKSMGADIDTTPIIDMSMFPPAPPLDDNWGMSQESMSRNAVHASKRMVDWFVVEEKREQIAHAKRWGQQTEILEYDLAELLKASEMIPEDRFSTHR